MRVLAASRGVMSLTDWNELTARLDAAVFQTLPDDKAASWTRDGVLLATIAVILETVERPSGRNSMAMMEMADVARMSVAALSLAAPGQEPAAGDVLTVSGRVLVVHGQPWRDDRMDGRDWLCPVRS